MLEHLLALLGRICQVNDLLIHLLFGEGFGRDGGGIVAIEERIVEFCGLVGVGVVGAEGVGGDCRLASFDGFLGSFEVFFE